MLRYNQLKFFNKKGVPIDLKYDQTAGKWSGNIYIPRVSVGLFESDTIYVIEQFEDLTSAIVYGTPHKNQLATTPKFNFSWADKEETINIFTLTNILDSKPEISLLESLPLNITTNAGDTYNNTTNTVISGNINPNSLRCDICCNSQTEGNFSRILQISDDYGIFASIEVYFEAVGEDERFNVWLNNLCGQLPIRNSDFPIFKNSDISEALLDYQILNNKRKELLLEYRNILPYLAGYRGLINVIKFFGYYDLRLKEYWKNADTGKYLLEDVKLFEDQNLDKIPTDTMKPLTKTGLFALYYDIVKESGEYDEFGLPKTVKAFQYSPEEILIKLYGLKNYIEINDVGGMATIADIVGEYVIYTRYGTKNWNERTLVRAFESNQTPNFISDKVFGYIYDLRHDAINACMGPRDWTAESYPLLQIATHSTCYVAYFNPYNRDVIDEFADEPNIPVGFKIKLTNKSFNLSWIDAQTNWINTAYQNLLITWANFESLNITEIGWTVKYVTELDKPDGRRFVYNVIGKKAALANHELILPYVGEYDVTLTLYGYNGEVTSFTKRKYIKLALPNADAVAYYRFRDFELQHWGTNKLSWKNINNQWKKPIYNNTEYSVDDIKIRFRSFKMVEFVDLEDTDNIYVGTNTPKWNRNNVSTWNDHKYLTWNQLVFPKERLSKFTIDAVYPNGILQVGTDVIQLPSDITITDFKKTADFLNLQTDFYPSLFSYIARPIDSPTYIDCVSLSDTDITDIFIGSKDGVVVTGDIEFSKWKDFGIPWKDEYLQWNMTNKFFCRVIQNPFTMDDSRVYNTAFRVPVMVPTFFVADSSAIAGKTIIIWTITDSFGNEILRINNKNLCFTFISPGFYTLTVDITDSNGNKMVNKKTNFVEVVSTDNFRANAKY